MKQDFKIKFDDDDREYTDSVTADEVIESTEPELPPIKPTESLGTHIHRANEGTVEIDERIAYKVGVLTIGIPILIVTAVTGVTQSRGAVVMTPDSDQTKTEDQVQGASTKSTNQTKKPAEEISTSEIQTNSSSIYTVEPNQTLYGISLELDTDFNDLAELNNIEPPYSISPGQELVLPEGLDSGQ